MKKRISILLSIALIVSSIFVVPINAAENKNMNTPSKVDFKSITVVKDKITRLSRVILQWNAVQNATAYEIYKIDSVIADEKKIATIKDTNYEDYDVNGTVYDFVKYRVRAINKYNFTETYKTPYKANVRQYKNKKGKWKTTTKTFKYLKKYRKKLLYKKKYITKGKKKTVRTKTVTKYTIHKEQVKGTLEGEFSDLKSADNAAVWTEPEREITLSTPTNIHNVDRPDGTIKFAWNPVENAEKYYIYEGGKSSSSFVGETATTEYTRPNSVRSDLQLRYYIKAVNETKNKASEFSEEFVTNPPEYETYITWKANRDNEYNNIMNVPMTATEKSTLKTKAVTIGNALLKKAKTNYPNDTILKGISNGNFGSISQALQVYVIGKSKAFYNHNDNITEYAIHYDLNSPRLLAQAIQGQYDTYYSSFLGAKPKNNTPLKHIDYLVICKMFNVFKNTTKGVCIDYAEMEYVLFKSLGITVDVTMNSIHAWTVVKAMNKNNKKALIIAFDYGLVEQKASTGLYGCGRDGAYATYITNDITFTQNKICNFTTADFV